MKKVGGSRSWVVWHRQRSVSASFPDVIMEIIVVGNGETKKLHSGVKVRTGKGAAVPKGKVKSLHHSTWGSLKQGYPTSSK